MTGIVTEDYKNILIDERFNGVWITLNRPDRRNALTLHDYAFLIQGLRSAGCRSDIHYVVIRGAGEHFCSGGDLDGFDRILNATPEERADISRAQHGATANALTQVIWDLPQPLVVAARGFAMGQGAQLILAADIAIVSETLRFSIPQVRLAHAPDHGESWYLPRRVGMTQAARLLLTGEQVSGAKAVDLGIASEFTEDATLDARLNAVTLLLAKGAGAAQRETKRLLRSSWTNDLSTQGALECEALARLVQTNDFEEAITAFSEKRPPTFEGAAKLNNEPIG